MTTYRNEIAARIARTARKNGCSPGTRDGWPYCRCPHGTHFADQQCSLISKESCKRRLLRLVVSR